MTQAANTEKKSLNSETTGVLLILIATVSLGTEAIAAKVAYREGANVMTTLTLRYAIAALFFWAFMFIRKYSWRLKRQQFTAVALLSVGGQAVTVLCLFYAFRYIPAAMAILFLYFYPTVVTILAYFFLKEPLTWRKATALILTLAGCAVILGQPTHGLDPKGVILALIAAVTNAIFLVGSTRMLTGIQTPVYTSYMTGFVFLVFLILGHAQGDLSFDLSRTAWEAIVFLGIVCTVVSMGALFRGVAIIGASRTAIISTLEPIVTALLGLWLLNESLTGIQMIGGALIMTGVLLQRRE